MPRATVRFYQVRLLLTFVVLSLLAQVALGQEKELPKPWVEMDYGPYLTASIEAPRPAINIAHKGLAIRVGGDRGSLASSPDCATLLFDTDLLRFATGWSGGLLSLTNVVYNGRHGTGSHLGIVGEPAFVNRAGPGWARPGGPKDTVAAFVDPRVQPYGPLPRDWAHWKGLYLHGDQVILSYSLGESSVLELPGMSRVGEAHVLTRTIEVGPSKELLTLQVCEVEGRTVVLPNAGNDPAKASVPVAGGADLFTIGHFRSEGEIDTQTRGPDADALRNGLVGHWGFDHENEEKLHNAAGERLQAKIVGVRRSRAGRQDGLDGCLWFYDRRGGHGRVNFESASDFQFGAEGRTVTAWIKTHFGGTLIAKTGGNWGAGAKSLLIREGKLVFGLGEGEEVVSERIVGDDRWHHVGLTIESGPAGAAVNLRLWVDGAPDSQLRLSELPADDAEHSLRLGYTTGSYPEKGRYRGLLDELRLYERALGAPEMAALAAQPTAAPRTQYVACREAPPGARWRIQDGAVRLELPPSTESRRFQLGLAVDNAGQADAIRVALAGHALPDLRMLTRGGPRRWEAEVETEIQPGDDNEAYAVDTLTPPDKNPWGAWMRFGGMDFFDDGKSAALGTWSGDVWTVRGIGQSSGKLRWRRIATGLFQVLGLKVIDGDIYACGRDQITILRDLNGDEETDFYENFNNDHWVSEHFHEFAMDIQRAANGDLYYAKGARHGHPALFPRHGTIIRVSKDGKESEIVAGGYRAPNGLCLNPDGSFFISDQEGNFNVANKIALVRPGEFHGNRWTIQPGGTPSSFTQPLCWLNPKFDNSPSEQLWVNSDRWGPLQGRLLSLSYGMGYIEHIFHETVDGQVQGGGVRLQIPQFPTGIMRARFHPDDGQLYVCGLFGWGGSRTLPGGFYRVRYTGKPVCIPLDLGAKKRGVLLTFSLPLSKRSANPKRFAVERWNYAEWSRSYGSKDYRLSDGTVGRDSVPVQRVLLSKDGRSVFLEIDDMKPCQQMEIRYRVVTADGGRLSQIVHHTIHVLSDDEGYRERFEG